MNDRFRVLHSGDFYRIFDYKLYDYYKNLDGSYYSESALDEVGWDRANAFCQKLNREHTTNKEVLNGQGDSFINTNDGVVESNVCIPSSTEVDNSGSCKNKQFNNSKTTVGRDKFTGNSKISRNGVKSNKAVKGISDSFDDNGK